MAPVSGPRAGFAALAREGDHQVRHRETALRGPGNPGSRSRPEPSVHV